ncbi:UDP-N-acetylmuramoyl-L-alanyl-D-glutamate--2,6-diaminopimelate ligase [Martelella alba]|uniref:UDP-N-acetylmuramoyl-L-alanyl-D-glutamate--2,6-diaminopimelate ligase n=1 Tax=Martelella alba TaxID=2590451 RepID=A0A506UJW2_9HYPH|nr:UDP-N-acetylmuramoyl-L-alanyl-D-glutamate--2,6-diaminopimelate ligase [Martelella alba]TPW33595.1 UDP-N-acetylmuramoyl-L-alanyl-D-glutamate--2,6-diaminopimelate ligase [Martelella alba]
MKFHDLAEAAIPGLCHSLPEAAGAVEISGLSADSRKITPGMLFVAIPGVKADGAGFVADAVSRGAAAVVSGSPVAGVDVPVLVCENPRLFLARAAAAFYHEQPAVMVAVTGTAGKTSVASFTRQIYARAGLGAAMIGTTGVVAPGRNDYGSLTTPDPVDLHKLLAELAGAGVTHAAMEASSHGLDQYRLDGVRLSAAAFTNLGRDHMDYHPTVDDYFAAKMHLFDRVLPKGFPAVINADDAFSERAAAAAKAAGHDVLTVGRNGAFLTLKRAEQKRDSQFAEIRHGGENYEVELPLAGDFQIANALVAAGLAIATGVSPATAISALGSLEGAPGRLQLVGKSPDGALAYVDYAHKPDALEKVLAAVRPFTTGRVLVVFGCGGDRDKGKRPIMGEIATRLADVVIVTDDNPRSEVPEVIRSEIMAAAPGATEIGDRRRAIAHAIGLLRQGDTLVVAGKGHEEGQTAGGVTRPFSDIIEVRTALEGLRS